MEIFNEVTNSNEAIKNISTLVLSDNPSRNYAVFVNDSDTVIYLSLGSGAVVNKGARLNSSGGSFELNTINLYKGPIYAIHGGVGDKNLCFIEGT